MDARGRELPVRIAFDGVVQPSETRGTIVGPHVLVFETAVPLPAIALTLVSTYTGIAGAETQVSHVGAGAGELSWSSHRAVAEEHMPVVSARQRCLVDHLAEAHQLLTTYGVTPTVDLGGSLPLALRD